MPEPQQFLAPGAPMAVQPNLAPGGLVFQAYSLDGELLLQRRIPASDAAKNVEDMAEIDREIAFRRSNGAATWLVVYDGDTGKRLPLREILAR